MNSNTRNVAKPILTPKLLLLLAIGAGASVANLYYNQPLLSLISHDLGESESAVSTIAMLTQLGYATGLLFIVPLGDMFKRKRIILTVFALMIASLLAFAGSKTLWMLSIMSFCVGITSVIPQIFIPLAAQLSKPENMAKNISVIVSGMLVGILTSRVFSGIIGDFLGWRTVYFIVAGMMLVLAVFVAIILPEITPTFKGTYRELMRSIMHYVRILPDLRMSALRGALAFASFSLFWSTLAFKLETPPFFAGSDVAGLLGLVGIAGVIAARITGKISNRIGPNTILTLGIGTILISWIVFGTAGTSYFGIITGIVLLDMGIQAMNVTNQSLIFSSHKEATSRINTAYMVTYFVGGALGTKLGGFAWENFGWAGVTISGGILLTTCLIVHLIYRGSKRIHALK